MLTHLNKIESILIDGPNIYQGFSTRLATARHSIDMAFYKWEDGSKCAALLGSGIRAAAEATSTPLLVRLIVSDSTNLFSGRSIDHLYDSLKKWRITGPNIRFQLATYPYSAFGSLHDKIVIVDGSTLLLTGANPEKQHDNASNCWHDTGYIISGGAAISGQSSFDESWIKHAKHWVCKPRRLQYDCQGANHPVGPRPWLQQSEFQRGQVSMITVGRTAWGGINDNTSNPQDQAWIELMRKAAHEIHVMSPNINSSTFATEIIAAMVRGVKIKVISSRLFNETMVNLAGGTNQEAVDRLYRETSHFNKGIRERLDLRWYSRNGRVPVQGNGSFASHVKYFSVDGEVAVIGSGNMDKQSWHHSREFNLLIDNAGEVGRLEHQIFLPAYEKSIVAASHYARPT